MLVTTSPTQLFNRIHQDSANINNKMKAATILSVFATIIAGVNAVAMSENQHAVRTLVSTIISRIRSNPTNAH